MVFYHLKNKIIRGKGTGHLTESGWPRSGQVDEASRGGSGEEMVDVQVSGPAGPHDAADVLVSLGDDLGDALRAAQVAPGHEGVVHPAWGSTPDQGLARLFYFFFSFIFLVE